MWTIDRAWMHDEENGVRVGGRYNTAMRWAAATGMVPSCGVVR